MIARILFGCVALAWLPLAAAQSPAPPSVSSPAAAPSAKPPVATTAPSTGDEPFQPTLGDDKETIAASEKWLSLLDDAKLGPAWDVSSKILKSSVTRKEWIKGITAARKPFGKLKSRTPERFARSHSLPGAPDGDYSIIVFETVFANGKKAEEQLIWALEGGDLWRVSGYFIR
ncbi:MAG: DUF4019 domain-containing protein [Betaproteobacteria bacterium]